MPTQIRRVVPRQAHSSMALWEDGGLEADQKVTRTALEEGVFSTTGFY